MTVRLRQLSLREIVERWKVYDPVGPALKQGDYVLVIG
jgi:hypothetical protein